jgi:acyl-CoA thioesterase I
MQRTPYRSSAVKFRAFIRYGAWATRFNVAGFRLLPIALVLALAVQASAAADPVRILAFGDSLTAGYGLSQGEGFTAQLEAALAEAGVEAEVINGGVSGDTTAGGLARLDWALADDPDLVILELGANDGLRGLDPAETRANLDAILTRLREADVAVLFAGMLAPPNLGPEFGKAFNAIYPELAERHDVALFPFFLDGVATDPALNQADGIHPNRAGVAVIVERILPYLLPIIEGLDRTAAGAGSQG